MVSRHLFTLAVSKSIFIRYIISFMERKKCMKAYVKNVVFKAFYNFPSLELILRYKWLIEPFLGMDIHHREQKTIWHQKRLRNKESDAEVPFPLGLPICACIFQALWGHNAMSTLVRLVAELSFIPFYVFGIQPIWVEPFFKNWWQSPSSILFETLPRFSTSLFLCRFNFKNALKQLHATLGCWHSWVVQVGDCDCEGSGGRKESEVN